MSWEERLLSEQVPNWVAVTHSEEGISFSLDNSSVQGSQLHDRLIALNREKEAEKQNGCRLSSLEWADVQLAILELPYILRTWDFDNTLFGLIFRSRLQAELLALLHQHAELVRSRDYVEPGDSWVFAAIQVVFDLYSN